MKNYTFDEMPNLLAKIEKRLDKIEEILSENSSATNSEVDYIDAQKACEILKFTKPTLYSKVCKRELPFYKQGNRLYFSKAELLDWIKDGKRKSANEINMRAQVIADDMMKGKLRGR